jgi:hypothetical protein
MDPTTTPDLFLSRTELIEALRIYGQSAETWDRDLPADLLEHASAELLTPEALAALAVARRCFDQATAAVLALDRAQLALATALEAGES